MNWIKKIFTTPVDFFKKLFSNGPEGFMKLIEKLSPVVNKAYPIVKKIAELTPTKTDDKILAAYEYYKVGHLFKADVDKGIALRDLAKQVIQDNSKDPLSDYVLNSAVELAYAKFKQELEQE